MHTFNIIIYSVHFCLRIVLIMSFVWSYYTISSEDSAIAVCTVCTHKIIRGCNPRCYSTSTLHKHLATKHSVIYTEVKKSKKAGSSTEKNFTFSSEKNEPRCNEASNHE